MAILTNTPSATPPEEPKKTLNQPIIQPPNYQGVTVDTKYNSKRSLLTHIDGSPWIVTYYQQALGKDSELAPQQLSKSAVYQQYIEISDLEIRVVDALSHSQDEDSRAFTVTGGAILYPPMVPNVGDMFIADIGDGREGVFAITNSTRMTILKESCFQVEYVLLDYSTPERRDDFVKKTIKRTHFVKRLLEHGENPIIVNDDYHQYLSFGEYQRNLTSQFFGEFFSRMASTMAVPDQERLTYDPFVVNVLHAFMDNGEHPQLQHVKRYSVTLPDRSLPQTIWDCLMRFSTDLLPMIHEKVAVVGSECFGVTPQYESVYFSNVEAVVYPVGMDGWLPQNESLQVGRVIPRNIQYQLSTTFLGSFEKLDAPKGDGIESLPPIYPVTYDDYYVLSEHFYRKDAKSRSQLETLVAHALEGTPINQRILAHLCKESSKWKRLERFYYLPILMILLKMAQRGH